MSRLEKKSALTRGVLADSRNKAHVTHISCFIAESNLAKQGVSDISEKIMGDIGVRFRRIKGETTLDICRAAVSGFFSEQGIDKDSIDYLLFFNPTPYLSFANTPLNLRNRLGFSEEKVKVVDYSLTGGRYLFGLGIARGLIESNGLNQVLLLSVENMGRYTAKTNWIEPITQTVAVTLVAKGERLASDFSSSKTTWGRVGNAIEVGGDKMAHLQGKSIVHRQLIDKSHMHSQMYSAGATSTWQSRLHVERVVDVVIRQAGLTKEDVDLFLLYQSSGYPFDDFPAATYISGDKMVYAVENNGESVFYPLPVALARAERKGKLRSGSKVFLAEFGVGSSFEASLLDIHTGRRSSDFLVTN